MYAGGMIFVDHASGFIPVEFVVTLMTAETIAAKHCYEREMLSQGVTVVAYQANNGTFSAASFVKELHDRFLKTVWPRGILARLRQWHAQICYTQQCAGLKQRTVRCGPWQLIVLFTYLTMCRTL